MPGTGQWHSWAGESFRPCPLTVKTEGSSVNRSRRLRHMSPTTDVTCVASPSFSWANNAGGQSPCLVWAYVLAACGAADFNVATIQAGTHYDEPGKNTGSGVTANPCSWCGRILDLSLRAQAFTVHGHRTTLWGRAPPVKALTTQSTRAYLFYPS